MRANEVEVREEIAAAHQDGYRWDLEPGVLLGAAVEVGQRIVRLCLPRSGQADLCELCVHRFLAGGWDLRSLTQRTIGDVVRGLERLDRPRAHRSLEIARGLN